jgi:hypothetical protein
MPGISWIISGREELLWASIYDPDWEMFMGSQNQSVATTQNSLDGLYHQMRDHETALKLYQSKGKSSNYPKQ